MSYRFAVIDAFGYNVYFIRMADTMAEAMDIRAEALEKGHIRRPQHARMMFVGPDGDCHTLPIADVRRMLRQGIAPVFADCTKCGREQLFLSTDHRCHACTWRWPFDEKESA